MDTPKRPRGRPKTTDPAVARLELRLTPGQKARWEAARKRQGAAGLSEWVKVIADREASE